jgi:phosphate transport system substrate-binding protein
MKRFDHCAILIRITLASILFASHGSAQTLQGAGSALSYSLYSKWFGDYRKHNPTIRIHYQPAGSSSGIDDLIRRKIDFSTTDIPLTEEQLKRASQELGASILQIPAVLDAVVPIYKVNGVDTELKFTGTALAGIYLGKITRWNDPEISNANPNVSLPDEKIIVIHRSDDSDTSYLWTGFLSHVSPDWKAGPGEGSKVKWPVGLGAKGDDGVEDLVVGPTGNYGVMDLVSSIPNSIGYVRLHYAIENKLPYGDVQNSSGAYVRATESSVMDAASSETRAAREMFRVSLADEPNQTGFPISSFTWILVPAKMQNKAKAKAMADFLTWMLRDGQGTAESLHFIKLPTNVVDRALAEIAKIQ